MTHSQLQNADCCILHSLILMLKDNPHSVPENDLGTVAIPKRASSNTVVKEQAQNRSDSSQLQGINIYVRSGSLVTTRLPNGFQSQIGSTVNKGDHDFDSHHSHGKFAKLHRPYIKKVHILKRQLYLSQMIHELFLKDPILLQKMHSDQYKNRSKGPVLI